jgi:hypothetical protein
LSGQLKRVSDRTFCYYAASCPNSAQHAAGMAGKRLGLLIGSEENYPAAPIGIVHFIEEVPRYTYCEFIGVVHGIGN